MSNFSYCSTLHINQDEITSKKSSVKKIDHALSPSGAKNILVLLKMENLKWYVSFPKKYSRGFLQVRSLEHVDNMTEVDGPF